MKNKQNTIDIELNNFKANAINFICKNCLPYADLEESEGTEEVEEAAFLNIVDSGSNVYHLRKDWSGLLLKKVELNSLTLK